MAGAPAAWRWHHILMGSGTTVTVAAAFWEALGSGSTSLVGAAIAFGLGAAFFLHFLQARVRAVPDVWFRSAVGRRRFAAFTVLTALGIILRGVAATQEGTAAGALLAGYGAVLLVAWIVGRDVPPFAHSAGTLGLGITLLG